MASAKNHVSEEAGRIGANIKMLRERARWTQQELANIAGTSATYLSSVERGERKPGSDLMLRLCEAFGVDERVIRFGDKEDVGNDMFTKDDLDLLMMLKNDPESYLAAKDLLSLDREGKFWVRTQIRSKGGRGNGHGPASAAHS